MKITVNYSSIPKSNATLVKVFFSKREQVFLWHLYFLSWISLRWTCLYLTPECHQYKLTECFSLSDGVGEAPTYWTWLPVEPDSWWSCRSRCSCSRWRSAWWWCRTAGCWDGSLSGTQDTWLYSDEDIKRVSSSCKFICSTDWMNPTNYKQHLHTITPKILFNVMTAWT